MNLVLDFTHTYNVDWIGENGKLKYIDCSDIPGTDMYCTPEAEEEIMRRIHQYSAPGIHFIDSGNYHYMTRIFTKNFKTPYNLVFFDNHNDCQPTMIPEFLSCGAWAQHTLEKDENLQKMILIGPGIQRINDIDVKNMDKLVCLSRDEIDSWGELNSAENVENWRKRFAEKLKDVDKKLPLYISVDKDVMSEEFARTNWDQGDMNLDELKFFLKELFDMCRDNGSKVLGVDICGELPPKESSFQEAAEAEAINCKVNSELLDYIDRYLESAALTADSSKVFAYPFS